MKTLLILGTLIHEGPIISLNMKLPSFAERFILEPEKQRNLEHVLGMQWKEKQTQIEKDFVIEKYEYTLIKKENYEFFLFGRTSEPHFQYNRFDQYPAIGIALRVEF